MIAISADGATTSDYIFQPQQLLYFDYVLDTWMYTGWWGPRVEVTVPQQRCQHFDICGANRQPNHLTPSTDFLCLSASIRPRSTLNYQNSNGFTALDSAIEEDHGETVKVLLEAGADPTINGEGPWNCSIIF